MNNRALIHLSIAALALLAAGAAYALAYLHVEAVGERIVSMDAEIQVKDIELKNIRDAQSELAALTESEARIRGYFVPTAEVVSFLERVGSSGDAFGTEVSVVSVNEDTAKDGRGTLTLSVQAGGTFDSVMRTIGTLEFAPYDIILTNLSLDATASAGAAWNASATYDIGTQTP